MSVEGDQGVVVALPVGDEEEEAVVEDVTRKLRTQSLKEKGEDPIQKSTTEENDSGSESDDEMAAEEEEEKEGFVFISPPNLTTTPPLPLTSTTTLLPAADLLSTDVDHYSSEEELKEIISSEGTRKKRLQRGNSSGNGSNWAKTPVSGSSSRQRMTGSSGCSSVAEKRKWSEMSESPIPQQQQPNHTLSTFRANSTSSGDEEVIGFLHHNKPPSSSSSPQTPAAAAASLKRASGASSCASMTPTPVQFCASPPLDVHRPLRASQSPPLKVFHMERNDQLEEERGISEADEEIVRQQLCNGGSGFAQFSGLSSFSRQGETPSPSKRHRSRTPRPHSLQRPCLDFEKMQQIKKRVVTSWRPHGTELSLFCW